VPATTFGGFELTHEVEVHGNRNHIGQEDETGRDRAGDGKADKSDGTNDDRYDESSREPLHVEHDHVVISILLEVSEETILV
jgi:hypothetical protein